MANGLSFSPLKMTAFPRFSYTFKYSPVCHWYPIVGKGRFIEELFAHDGIPTLPWPRILFSPGYRKLIISTLAVPSMLRLNPPTTKAVCVVSNRSPLPRKY